MKEHYISEYEIIRYIVNNPEYSQDQVAIALKIPIYLVREIALRMSKVDIYYWISQSTESYRICNIEGYLP